MKSNALIILLLIITVQVHAQQQGGFEQYYYVKESQPLVMMPIAHFQTRNNWYTEARFNYEEMNTFSLYAGKIFSGGNKLSYTIIPILGGVMGEFKGGSLGLNLNVEFKQWYLSSQSQYTFSSQDKTNNFFYSWSEAGYEVWDWLYAGIALQHTTLHQTKTVLEPGIVVGFSVGKWSFPLYSFNPMGNNRSFLLGINRTLK
jgi:hypothetical protein